MKCFYCEKEAVGICNYCGKAICKDCGSFEEVSICKNSDFCNQRKAYGEAVELYNNKFTFKFPNSYSEMSIFLVVIGFILLISGVMLFLSNIVHWALTNIFIGLVTLIGAIHFYKLDKQRQ